MAETKSRSSAQKSEESSSSGRSRQSSASSSEGIEISRDDVMNSAREVLSKVSQYIESEARQRPYAVLGAAASAGFILGQGLFRAAIRLGMLVATQEAMRRVGQNASGSLRKQTIH